jgi:hypothetical protein
MSHHSTGSSTATPADDNVPLVAFTVTIRRIHVAVLSIILTAALILLAGNTVPAFLATAACVAVAAGGGLRIALQSTARSKRRPPLLTLFLGWLPGGIALALSIVGAVLIFAHPTTDPLRILGVGLFAVQILLINLLIVRPAADPAAGTAAA